MPFNKTVAMALNACAFSVSMILSASPALAVSKYDLCRRYYFESFDQHMTAYVELEKRKQCKRRSNGVSSRLLSLRCEIIMDTYKPNNSSSRYLGQSKYEMAQRYSDSQCEHFRGR